jgi:Glu-tRNA(Gln) amidotransferase subunit E-like FAD-binding protein
MVVRTLVSERKDLVKERGINLLGILISLVMEELRGKADGSLIWKTLHEELWFISS